MGATIMPDLMSQSRGERLIQLYQYLPRGEKNAKTLSELIQTFNPTGEKPKSRSKLLEQDLLSLFNLWGEQAIGRIPNWTEGNITGKTPKYYLQSNFSLDNFDNENLFFWEMLDKFTAHFLPKDVHNQLEQKISKVQQSQQKKYQISDLGQWKNHLITLPSVLQAPQFDNDILTIIHQAIREQKALEFNYQKKWHEIIEKKIVYPVGLVFVDNMVYLTGFYPLEDSLKLKEKDYLKQQRVFAVIRISQATILDKLIPTWVEQFTLPYLQKIGVLERYLTKQTTIQLKLQIDYYASQHLTERPLSNDQKIERFDDDSLIVTATVENTERLENWLMGMASSSQVLEPDWLRQAMIKRLKSALSYYE